MAPTGEPFVCLGLRSKGVKPVCGLASTIRLKATLSNQSMNQHGAVEPPSRLDARAVQECLFFISPLQLDSTHLAGDAELEQFYW